jgi:cell wall-associated NlpC family hydrolase
VARISAGEIGKAEDRREVEKFLEGGINKKVDLHNLQPDQLIKTANRYMGVPHCMGGTTRKCMDCSGLLYRAFSDHGISMPHNSEELARYGKIIPGKKDLKKGDLVFFVHTYRTSRFITHSGIYIGDQKFLHTSSSRGVTISSLENSWWQDKFIFGTRIF